MEPFPKKKLRMPREIKVVNVDIKYLYCCSAPDVKGLGPWIIASDVCDYGYLQECEGTDGGNVV